MGEGFGQNEIPTKWGLSKLGLEASRFSWAQIYYPTRGRSLFLVRLFQLEFNTLCTEVCVHSARGGGGTWGVCFRTNSLFYLRGKELVGDDDWKTMRNSPVPHKHPHRIASVGMHVPTDRGPSPVARWIDRADSKEKTPEDERQSEWCQPQGQRCQPHQSHQPRPQSERGKEKNQLYLGFYRPRFKWSLIKTEPDVAGLEVVGFEYLGFRVLVFLFGRKYW